MKKMFLVLTLMSAFIQLSAKNYILSLCSPCIITQ
jgi:hypothetical protein